MHEARRPAGFVRKRVIDRWELRIHIVDDVIYVINADGSGKRKIAADGTSPVCVPAAF